MTGMRRRDLLTGTAVALVGGTLARAEVITGKLPWHADQGAPPQKAQPGGWKFFTAAEAAMMEAVVRPPHTARPRDSGRQGRGLRGIYRPTACRRVRQARGPVQRGAVPRRHRAAGAAVGEDTRRTLPCFTRRARSLLPRQTERRGSGGQSVRGTVGRAAGRRVARSRGRQRQARKAPTARSSSPSFSRTRSRDSSPIRFTAATATCAPGR
jgi:hypothetical protein